MTTPLLRVEGLTAGYRTVRVLSDLTLEVGRGSIVTVVGPNGAGKTTLARAIAGFARVFSGDLVYDGERIGSWPAERRANQGIASVPEGRRLFPTLTVDENLQLALFARRRKVDRSRRGRLIADAYGRFPSLAARQRQKAGSLSGGEQQMLAIARALILEPRLLILDEPSTGLAPIIVEQILTHVQEIATAQGCGCLLIEQQAVAALEVSESAYVLDRGRVVFGGRADAVLADDRLRNHYLGGPVPASSDNRR